MNDFNELHALYHHGIKGQKWGVRRFQNEDGTLTAEGKARYGIDENGNMSKEGLALYKQDTKNQKKIDAPGSNGIKTAAKTGVITAATSVAVGTAACALALQALKTNNPTTAGIAKGMAIVSKLGYAAAVPAAVISGIVSTKKNEKMARANNN